MDELNAVLPSEEVTSEQIEDTMAMLSDMGINVIEDEDVEEAGAASTSNDDDDSNNDEDGEGGEPRWKRRVNSQWKSTTADLASLPQRVRQQFGALCYRVNGATNELEVLFITTRESHRWTIPKGWPMGDKSAHRSAEVEAQQEAGVLGKISKKAFGYFTYLKCLADGEKVPCTVEMHLLKVDKMSERYKEQGQPELLWCSCFEAAVKVGEPELKGLFRLLHEAGHASHQCNAFMCVAPNQLDHSRSSIIKAAQLPFCARS